MSLVTKSVTQIEHGLLRRHYERRQRTRVKTATRLFAQEIAHAPTKGVMYWDEWLSFIRWVVCAIVLWCTLHHTVLTYVPQLWFSLMFHATHCLNLCVATRHFPVSWSKRQCVTIYSPLRGYGKMQDHILTVASHNVWTNRRYFSIWLCPLQCMLTPVGQQFVDTNRI